MCVALVTTPGKMISTPALFAGWKRNSDGGGFAFVKDGKVQIRKGYMEFASFRDAYQEHAEKYSAESPFLVHMRISTSGGTTEKNTHPFPIRGGALIHNGVMFHPTGTRAGPPTDRKSDTRVFAESLYNILQLEHVKKVGEDIRKAVGYGNKICFLYDDAQFHIIGEKLGDWDDGIWHSNNSCVISGAA